MLQPTLPQSPGSNFTAVKFERVASFPACARKLLPFRGLRRRQGRLEHHHLLLYRLNSVKFAIHRRASGKENSPTAPLPKKCYAVPRRFHYTRYAPRLAGKPLNRFNGLVRRG